MHEAHSYHGHSIELDIAEYANGHFKWTYFIDRMYCFQSEHARSVLHTVRSEVLARAHRAVEQLELIRLDGRDGPDMRCAPDATASRVAVG